MVPESAVALKPANLDFVQAASIPMVGLTSWQALKERAKVGTTTSTSNIKLVLRLGVDEVVNYKQQDFEKMLRGYDAVLGTVRGDA